MRDIGAILDWIKRDPALDPARVAVAGGSYGGYMSLASMTHFSDRLRCGVDVVGISSFLTFLKNTQDYRRDLRRVENAATSAIRRWPRSWKKSPR